MTLKKRFLFPLIVLVCVLLFSVIYFGIFSKVTVVQDKSWKQVLPKGFYRELRDDFFKKGYRLSVKNLEVLDALDSSYLRKEMAKLDTNGIVITSPVVTAAIDYLNIDIKEEMQRVSVFGIGANNDSDFFDVVLVSDPVSGWKDAADKNRVNGSKSAILYDNGTLAEAKIIFDTLEGDTLRFNKNEYGALFESEIQKEMKNAEIKLVFCPHVDSLSDFVEDAENYKWITDYRYSGVIPKKYLYGVVCPDIVSSINDYLKPSAFGLKSNTGTLLYEYRKAR